MDVQAFYLKVGKMRGFKGNLMYFFNFEDGNMGFHCWRGIIKSLFPTLEVQVVKNNSKNKNRVKQQKYLIQKNYLQTNFKSKDGGEEIVSYSQIHVSESMKNHK